MRVLCHKIKSGIQLGRSIGWMYVLRLFIVTLINRDSTKLRVARQKIKLEYVRERFKHHLERCKSAAPVVSRNDGPVWVCWWQGEAQMPSIVRFCYSNLKKAVPENRKVVLITKENFKEYTNLPDYVIKKVESGMITLTHLTDILRVSLLAEHGGLWIDSTVYVNGRLPDSVFEKPYFSAKAPYDPKFVNRCEYTSFLLATGPRASWVIYARDVLFEYWEKAVRIPEYLFIDYILITAFDNNSILRECIKPGIMSTPHIHRLELLRNAKCDEVLYDKMMKECKFFKLSCKLEYEEYTDDGKLTYYGKLMKNYY